jgi:hypothetical protein
MRAAPARGAVIDREMRMSVLRWFAIVVAAMIAAAIAGLPMSPLFQKFSEHQSDFHTHANVARLMASGGRWAPHWLFHGLVVLVHTLMPSSTWLRASWVVVILSYAAQGAVLCWLLMRQVAVIIAIPLAIGIVIASPITIFTWDHTLYFGYLNMESWLSPTHAMLKPLAIVVMAFATSHPSIGRGLWLATASVAATLTKPSLAVSLLPASTVIVIPNLFKRPRDLHSWYLPLALILPTAIALLWQFLAYFGTGSRSDIVFAPLLVMGHYSKHLAPKFFLSIALPLTVLAVYGRKVFDDAWMRLAWPAFLVAAAYTYLLSETRFPLAGNWVWPAQITTYLLFVGSVLVVLRRRGLARPDQLRTLVCAVIFGLHVLCGIVFYRHPNLVGPLPPP